MSFSPGENVGPYRIIEQLGQGGMATVYKAYHAGLDRYVAIKALHPAFKQDASFVGRFEREARIVAKLDHPNIIPIYDFSEHEGTSYIVIRYIEGTTLKHLLLDGMPTIDRIQSILHPVTDALAYAHAQGVLHRDIKPSNIIIANDGHIYLADFGLARMADIGGSTLSQDMLIGTPQYISPEQAKGDPIDARSDLYSLGVVIFEMLTGRVPFSADTPYAVIHDHIYSPLPLPRSINPNLSSSLEQVLLKALAKDPGNRYATATELMTALDEATKSESTVSPRGALTTGFSLPRVAPAGFISLVALGVLLIAIILLGITQGSGRPLPGFLASLQGPTPTAAPIPTVFPTLPAPTDVAKAIESVALVIPSSTAQLSPTRTAPSVANISSVATGTGLPFSTWTRAATGLTPANTATPEPGKQVVASSPTVTPVPDMVLVPEGPFWMGKSADDAGASPDESPGHFVDLKAYYIDKYEVSNAQYKKCVDAGVCPLPAGVFSVQSPHMAFGNPNFDDYSVVFVSQGNASQYCVWAGKRLPTEAEWEKAARGNADQRIYPWGNTWDGYRANAAQEKPGPLPVHSYTPEGCSPFGACNMVGNVAEWVADYYASNFYADSQKLFSSGALVENPVNWNANTGKFVIRGGSFRSDVFDARLSRRRNQAASITMDDVGFRCAADVK